ncbi:peptidase S8/S53 domain-containing protein [Aspergillus aurantiobrunneus]
MHLVLYLATVLTTVLGAGTHIIHERREVLPGSWTGETRLAGQEVLPVRIGLAQSNLDRGHDLLMDVSDPTSPQYGKHLVAEAVHELFAPSSDTVGQVRSWLESEGISRDRVSQSANRQWLQFDASGRELERLLHTEYYLYSHAKTGRWHVACREYHVPRSLQSHIDYITPGIKMLELAGQSQRKRSLDKRSAFSVMPPTIRGLNISLAEVLDDVLSYCDVVITPACIRAMYNITKGTSAIAGNELGVFETLGDIYSQEDLELFFSSLASNIPNSTHPTLHSINGAQAPAPVDNAGPESSIDFQVAYPLIWPQNTILFQTDDPVYQNNYDFDGFLNNFLDAIDGSYCSAADEDLDPPYPNPAPGGYKGQKQCGVYKPTNVISISYGGAEASLPVRYLRRQCHEWMKLGIQGVSVIVASGDNGVATADCLGEHGQIFDPGFPAVCPYITVAGATYLPRGGNPYKPNEIAVTSFASGGGFSNVFERPWYQSAAVEAYFSRANVSYPYYESVNNISFGDNGGIYNRIGRAYPDVSAVGDNLLVFNRGVPNVCGGTSASAPVFAAMLTRINEERLAVGRPTVGFVNPVLYAHPEVFRDVTEGNNTGCGTDGFSAAEGWDPVTGLGTPVYSRLLQLFMGV